MRNLRAGLLFVGLLAALASCARDHPSPGPGEAEGDRAPPVIRELMETDNIISAGLDLYAVGAEVPADFTLSSEAARQGLLNLSDGSGVTWIGHATFLIRIGGKNILTDPIFSDRAFSDVIGPRRLPPLALDIDDLPLIDVIVISHADVDHLDMRSLERLAGHSPQAVVITPWRNADLLADLGFRQVRELRWHEAATMDGLTIRALPAYHANRREPGNPFRRRWAGYGLEAGGRKIFFAGDTAYGPAFSDIRRRYGAYDVALVPIGAYEPRPAVSHIHVNPEEAAQIGRDLGAPLAIGMHWGTFALSGEPFMAPRDRFLKAAGGGVVTRTLRIGETLLLR